ncbi:MAG: OmpH family outer membrane protein [Gammaproteobacteria bacterium]|nr:MAG: OmpH family outer membrane protein [Gammaproteobacteria bacterium]
MISKRKGSILRIYKGLVFGMACLLAWLPLTAYAELKIAYVNAVKAIEEAPQAKAALVKLEAEFRPRDKKLVMLQSNIKTMEDRLEKEALVMKPSERRSLEKELIVSKRNLRRATQEFREDYNLRRNEELSSLQKLVYKVIVDIAKKEKYDLVVHEGIIYASKSVDITSKVLNRLSKKK